MGLAHFESMLEEAVLRDAEAMPAAILMYEDSKKQEQLGLPGIWHDTPFSRVMRVSRGLRELDAQFTSQMQALLASGRIIVYTAHPDKKTLDPRVFTFDDLVMPRESFAKYLQKYQ